MIKIAIDLDNTITADKNSVMFFRTITHLLIPENDIIIISDRDESDMENTEQELSVLGIRYNKLVLISNKAEYISENKITIFFENQDEYFLELGEDGNFDFSEKKWIGSHKTTKMVD